VSIIGGCLIGFTPGSQSGWSSVVRRKGFSSRGSPPGRPRNTVAFVANGTDEIVGAKVFAVFDVDTKMGLT
jgi:hypothetical protein